MTVTSASSDVARRMWRLLEPVHALVYFAPEAKDIYAAAGLRGGWMGYFASRSAAMGAVGPGVVVATFHNFAPAMAARSLPDAWRLSSPERVLEARRAVASGALRRLLGEDAEGEAVKEAAALARQASTGCAPQGRPIFAAHADRDWPDEPLLALWWAATLLREHRFDGHVHALVAAGIDGCECHVLATLRGGWPAEMARSLRGWSEADWSDAERRLAARGLLADGSLTEAGTAANSAIEARTDELAAAPWAALGEAATERLAAVAAPLTDRLLAGGALPFPNPVGLTRPDPSR